jgi:hypothetical protein
MKVHRTIAHVSIHSLTQPATYLQILQISPHISATTAVYLPALFPGRCALSMTTVNLHVSQLFI